MSKRNTLTNKVEQSNPINLPHLDIKEVDEAGYGKIEGVGDFPRMIAEPIAINNAVPDPAQPRNLLPSKIRTKLNSKPEKIGGLLMEWQKLAEKDYGAIPTKQILENRYSVSVEEIREEVEGDGIIIPELPPITEEYLKILELATSIKQDGLINPITITTTGTPRTVIAGERRYFAYHLLNMFFPDEGYDKIPAFQKPSNVWIQAAENQNRRPLNAIGIASQVALLLMDIYKDEDGADFQPYHQLVVGENEQPFYAQVKNGKVYRLKAEFAKRIMDATGLKSPGQVRQYRRLLDIPAEIWVQANDENWTEFAIRTHINELNNPQKSVTPVTLNDNPPTAERSSFSRFGNTGDTVGSLQRPNITPPAKTGFIPESPSPDIKAFMLSVGVLIMDKVGEIWAIEKPPIGGNKLYACINERGTRKNVHINQIKSIIPPEDETVGTMPALSDEENIVTFQQGDKVRTRTGHTGQVIGMNGRYVLVSFGNYSTNHKPQDLELIYQEDEPVGTSVEETIEDEPQQESPFIFAQFDNIFMPLFTIAKATKMKVAAKSIRELGDMPIEVILKHAEEGTIEETFQSYYDSICLMLDQTKHHLHEIINSVEKFALEETGQLPIEDEDD